MFIRRRRRRAAADPGTEAEELPMTPMIDIVFQLLIFFMLTMQFKEVEGKLMSSLPKDKGPSPHQVPDPELHEIRIVLCAGGDIERHTTHRGAHEEVAKDGVACLLRVEKHDIGRLARTADRPGAAATNRGLYRQASERARDLREIIRSSRDPNDPAPLILDTDSEVPYEHVIGVINGLKEAGIDNVEFAGNPKHAKIAR